VEIAAHALRNNTASLRYNTAFMLRNLGWGLSYLRHATHSAFEETTTALDALIRLSTAEHQRLLAEVGESRRLRDNGWLFLYRSQAAFDGGQLGRATMDHFGVRTQVLDAPALHALEPVLRPSVFTKALWIQDTYSVDSPGQVTAAYARAFAARGGIVSTRQLHTLQRNGEGWDVLDDSGQASYFDQVVVALGPWSKQFMGRLGIRVPMAFERGYHMHYAADSASPARLQRPVYDTGGAYVLAHGARPAPVHRRGAERLRGRPPPRAAGAGRSCRPPGTAAGRTPGSRTLDGQPPHAAGLPPHHRRHARPPQSVAGLRPPACRFFHRHRHRQTAGRANERAARPIDAHPFRAERFL
jgi:hypothetical protein